MYRPTSAVTAVEMPNAGMKLTLMNRNRKMFAAIALVPNWPITQKLNKLHANTSATICI